MQAAVCPGLGPAESCCPQLSSSSTAAAATAADQPASTAIPGTQDEVGDTNTVCDGLPLDLFGLVSSVFGVHWHHENMGCNILVCVCTEPPRASYLLLPALCLYQTLVLCGKCRTHPLRLPAHQTSSKLLQTVSLNVLQFLCLNCQNTLHTEVLVEVWGMRLHDAVNNVHSGFSEQVQK